MDNVAGTTEVALATFGGLDTELGATDLPQGLSPECYNVAFLPGSVFTRPPLQREYAIGDAQILYAKDYLKPDGTVSLFALDSKGRMYLDGTQIGVTKAGNRVKAVNAFGRMYLAISDGIHGQDVPLQLDVYGNLDRVSQDGPGGAPTITNYSIPAQSLVTGSSGTPVIITTATPGDAQQVQISDGNDDPRYGGGYNPPQYATYYMTILYATAAPHFLHIGDAVSVSGNSLYNAGAAYVSDVLSATQFKIGYQQQNSAVGNGGSVVKNGALLVRSNGQVTANTASPHNLRVGYRFNLTGIADQSFSISSIAVNNDTAQGVGLVTTSTAHSLVPGNQVSILNVPNLSIGFQNYTVNGGVATVNTTVAHNLHAGDQVLLSLGSTGSPVVRVVSSVASATQFTATTGDAAVSTPNTNGSLAVQFPADSGQTFAVQAVPSATTFNIALNGPSETWTGGSVSFPWNGTFFVTSVPSSTSLTYAQSGPDATVQSGSGTITPQGQIAPGQHKCWVVFRTRQGYLTRPGPPVTINASGNQYLFVSNIPLGPNNVVARYLLFTGANGSKPYYLPFPPSLNGQVVGTSTAVNDNATTSAIFDFADEALLSGTKADAPGANLFRQEVLESACGVFFYAERMFAWGERNRVPQFFNMGFEGGYSASAPDVPLGWNVAAPGILGPSSDYGQAWTFGTVGTPSAITQGAYQDQFGVPILQPKTRYQVRAYVNGSLTWELYSPSQGVLASATLVATGFGTVPFNADTPVTIPQDTVIRLYANTANTMIDELSLVYAANPYRKDARVSYVDNPEAFDGVTGRIGPATDPHAVQAFFQRKEVLHLLTEGPQGALYETQDSADTEPALWNISQVATQCGAVSVWGDAQFEDWQVWASDTGLRIYSGGDVEKLSQEVQSLWNAINPLAKQFISVANDPYTRRMYMCVPQGTATVPTITYVLDYREMNTAGALANSGPYAIAQSGKVYTSDLRRKWTTWTMKSHFVGLLRSNGAAKMCFCGASGVALSQSGSGAIYSLNEGNLSGVDADYGTFATRYTTYFFVQEDEAQQLRLSPHRKQAAYLTVNVSGQGQLVVTPLLNDVSNAFRSALPRTLSSTRQFDTEIPQNCIAERIAYRLDSSVVNGVSGFRLSSFVLGLRTSGYSPLRGSAL